MPIIPLAPETGLAGEAADRPAAPFPGVDQPLLAGFEGPVAHYGDEPGEEVAPGDPKPTKRASKAKAEAPAEPAPAE